MDVQKGTSLFQVPPFKDALPPHTKEKHVGSVFPDGRAETHRALRDRGIRAQHCLGWRGGEHTLEGRSHKKGSSFLHEGVVYFLMQSSNLLIEAPTPSQQPPYYP